MGSTLWAICYKKKVSVSPNDGLSSAVQNSTKLAIVGDSGRIDNLIETVRDADALVIEATYIDEEETMAPHFSHLTARDAAALAVRAGVKQLILTHPSRRYRAEDVLAQAHAVFPNTVVARDFDIFRIGDEGV